jgi:serine O-acetyltransferase
MDAEPPLTFWALLYTDARAAAAFRGERPDADGRWSRAVLLVRLAVQSDAYLAQSVSRWAAWRTERGARLGPAVARRLARILAQIGIDPDVHIGPGLYIAHGQVAIEGATDLGSNVVLFPWVTIRPAAPGGPAPVIGPHVRIGTGAVIEGPVRIGRAARIGANAVVTDDVAPGEVVAGNPARAVSTSSRSGADARPGTLAAATAEEREARRAARAAERAARRAEARRHRRAVAPNRSVDPPAPDPQEGVP